MARTYIMAAVAIILVLVFGILNNTITIALAQQQQQQQQQQITGKINGMGTSQIPLRVCSKSFTGDFLTVKFDASFLLSSDGKTGTVTSGSGILKTTDSGVFAPLSITGGTINIGVNPKLYTLKGVANFQSPSFCNPPSAVKFSIAKPHGTELNCGDSDLITFNSIPLTGSVSGDVKCTPIMDTTPPTVIATLTPNVPDGQNGFYVHPVTITWSGDDGPTGSGISSCSGPTLYSGPNGSSIVLEGHCTDKAGNVGKGSVTIAYNGNTPTINIPASIIIKDAASPQGVVVAYTVSATDAVDGIFYITSECFPASGSTFKIGTTTVACKATDSAGNAALTTFRVIVNQHTTTTPAQNAKIDSTFNNHGRPQSDGTTTTNLPSSPSLSSSPPPQPQQQQQQFPQPQQQQQLPQPQQQLLQPRLSPTQPPIPVQPGESGQTTIATSPPHQP